MKFTKQYLAGKWYFYFQLVVHSTRIYLQLQLAFQPFVLSVSQNTQIKNSTSVSIIKLRHGSCSLLHQDGSLKGFTLWSQSIQVVQSSLLLSQPLIYVSTYLYYVNLYYNVVLNILRYKRYSGKQKPNNLYVLVARQSQFKLRQTYIYFQTSLISGKKIIFGKALREFLHILCSSVINQFKSTFFFCFNAFQNSKVSFT